MDKKLYYVDSVKPSNDEESFIARLLSQEHYSFKAEEKFVKLSPTLIDHELISYYQKKKNTNFQIPYNHDNKGFRDGIFIMLNESKKQTSKNELMLLTQEDLQQENIILYSEQSQLDVLDKLKFQKYKKKPKSKWDIPSTTNSISQEPELYCFNVKQGDMSLFISSEGNAYIIDTHITETNKKHTLDALKNILKGRPVKALILTHRHIDHFAGAYLLLKDKDIIVKSIILNQSFATKKQPNQIDKLLNLADQKGCKISAPKELKINEGKTEIRFSFHEGCTEENDNSTLIQIYYNNKLYYLTGDMGVETLETEKLTYSYNEIILKVSHHGSRTGTSCKFLDNIINHMSSKGCGLNNNCIYQNNQNRPKIKKRQAFISVGEKNRYKHPHQECITSLQCADFDIKQSKSIKHIYEKY